jgi:4-diphosphocytidyl-2C-methyl-D-erythritol kinase
VTRKTMTLPAFAKINLDLRILGSRPDGYHDLRTTFQSLALADQLTFTTTPGPMTITCDDPTVPTARPAASRCTCASAFRSKPDSAEAAPMPR